MKTLHLVQLDTQHAPVISKIRQTVFTLEQKIDVNEHLDGLDPHCLRALVKKNSNLLLRDQCKTTEI
ncbi:MAG: hypothetical protein KAG28_04065 [Cocleimonas sp.]|nr:hypothetical protein [Cocleimonas sp.]